MSDPTTYPPDGGEAEHVVVLVVRGRDGVTVHAVIDGQQCGTPSPITERAASRYLRVLLPWITR